jgi:hypothetical protein
MGVLTMTAWIKPSPWNGNDLKGTYRVTLKVDGVHAILSPDGARSRNDKPLYNLDHVLPLEGSVRVEVYCGSLKTSIQAVRTRRPGTPPVNPDHIYRLTDPIDERLEDIIREDTLVNPTAEQIRRRMKIATDAGFEGLVLRGETKWLKVKPDETHDVVVTGIEGGSGRLKGTMGKLLIGKAGKVGTGFTDEERDLWWARRHHIPMLDKHKSDPKATVYLIEVGCMGVNPTGKFRHSRYLRDRTWDKPANE